MHKETSPKHCQLALEQGVHVGTSNAKTFGWNGNKNT
jgi:hypothetical protein